MKAKIARRRLRRNAWKIAKAAMIPTLSPHRGGIFRQWKIWTTVALKEK